MKKLGKYFWFFIIAVAISLVAIFGAIYMSKNQIGLTTMLLTLLKSAGYLLYILAALGLYIYGLWQAARKRNTALIIGSVLLMIVFVSLTVYWVTHNMSQWVLYTGWTLTIPAVMAWFSR